MKNISHVNALLIENDSTWSIATVEMFINSYRSQPHSNDYLLQVKKYRWISLRGLIEFNVRDTIQLRERKRKRLLTNKLPTKQITVRTDSQWIPNLTLSWERLTDRSLALKESWRIDLSSAYRESRRNPHIASWQIDRLTTWVIKREGIHHIYLGHKILSNNKIIIKTIIFSTDRYEQKNYRENF